MTIKINGDNTVANPGFSGDDTDTGLQVGTDELKLVTGGTARVTVDSSGDVGIGTSSPSVKLDVEDPATTVARLSCTATGTYTTKLGFKTQNGSTSNSIGFDTSDAFKVVADGTEVITAESDGSVGVGTSAPDSLLEVEGSATSGGIISRCTSTQANDTNKALRVRNNSDTNTFHVAFNGQSRIYAENDGLEIYADIGTANTGGGKGHLLIKRGTNNVLVGSITSTTTSTAYNETSDYRLKENVVNLDGAIDRVKQLTPRRFNFIADADTTVDGFIAHEAQAVVPEAVTGTQDEVDDEGNPVYQGIDKSKLVPLLTAALQEAIAKIETLETKVTALENA